MTGRTFDPIELEILWQSLIATVNEQAKALQRAAFSPIVREAGDLANAVFDRRARMVAQAVTGTPGHINSLAHRRRGDPRRVPARHVGSRRRADHQRSVQDGRPAARRHGARAGVARRAGHRLLRLDHPPHRRRRLRHRRRRPGRVRGRPVDPDLQADVAGERNDDVWKFILSNVRQPDHMAGDLHAQMASGEVGAQRLLALCDQHGLDDIEALADEIIERIGGRHPGLDPRPAGAAPTDRTRVLDLADGSRIDIDVRADASTPTPARSPSTTRARPRPARGASTSSRTTPTPTRRSRCAACSTPTSPTTTAAWRRSRSRRPRARSSTPCRPSRARPATSSGCSCPTRC